TNAAISAAAENGHLRVVEYLHENRTGICQADAILRAKKNKHTEVVKYLLKHDECRAANEAEKAKILAEGRFVTVQKLWHVICLVLLSFRLVPMLLGNCFKSGTGRRVVEANSRTELEERIRAEEEANIRTSEQARIRTEVAASIGEEGEKAQAEEKTDTRTEQQEMRARIRAEIQDEVEKKMRAEIRAELLGKDSKQV
ncbi:hypothetical protein PF002_g30363, partial [Phytophthora fragariae]